MKNAMRGIGWMIAFAPSIAHAGLANEPSGMSLLVYLFLAVIVLIICTQVIPACALFFSMIKNVFLMRAEKEADEEEAESGRAP